MSAINFGDTAVGDAVFSVTDNSRGWYRVVKTDELGVYVEGIIGYSGKSYNTYFIAFDYIIDLEKKKKPSLDVEKLFGKPTYTDLLMVCD